MKFLIDRVSESSETQPCEGTHHETYTRVEVRTLPNAEAFDKKFAATEGAWLSKGTNHRKIGRNIARDHSDGVEGWFREFDTLEELIAFGDEHGELILGWSMWNGDVRQIRIFDGYL